MNYLIALLGLGITLIVHEMGHFLVLRRKNLVESLTIGVPVPKLTLVWVKNGVTYRLSPFLFLGAVETKNGDQRILEKESIGFQLAVYLGGVLANFLFAALLLFLVASITNGFWVGLKASFGLLVFILTEGVPILFSLIIHPAQLINDATGAVGLVGSIGQLVAPTTSFWIKLCISVLFCNLTIGLFQLLPIPPLDGGKVLFVIPKKLFPRAKNAISYIEIAFTLSMLCFIVFISVRDVFRLF